MCSVKKESWVIVPSEWVIAKPTRGPDFDTGDEVIFPYTRERGYFLCGFSDATKAKLHEYGPFNSLKDVEIFASSHNISIQATRCY